MFVVPPALALSSTIRKTTNNNNVESMGIVFISHWLVAVGWYVSSEPFPDVGDAGCHPCLGPRERGCWNGGAVSCSRRAREAAIRSLALCEENCILGRFGSRVPFSFREAGQTRKLPENENNLDLINILDDSLCVGFERTGTFGSAGRVGYCTD